MQLSDLMEELNAITQDSKVDTKSTNGEEPTPPPKPSAADGLKLADKYKSLPELEWQLAVDAIAERTGATKGALRKIRSGWEKVEKKRLREAKKAQAEQERQERKEKKERERQERLEQKEQSRITSLDIILTIKELGYTIQASDLDDSILVNGERMTDITHATITAEVMDRLDVSERRIQTAYMRHAGIHRTNPIKEFFNSLTGEWEEGDPDHLTEFYQYLNLEETEQYYLFMRWLFGVIGKAMNNEQNFVLVIDGKQGKGKSYFARWLSPIVDLHVEGDFNPTNKDHRLRMCRTLTWELGELQAVFKKADRERLKQALTEEKATIRKPYDRHDTEKPITCSFIGTINDTGAGFLNDPTGSRRFAVIRTLGFDWNYSDKINQRGLWAQLWYYYSEKGMRGYLTEEEAEYRDRNNARYQETPPIVELFQVNFTFAIGDGVEPLTNQKSRWTSSEIVSHIMEHNGLTGLFDRHKAQLEEYFRQVGVMRSRRDMGQNTDERTAVYYYSNVWCSSQLVPDTQGNN